MRSKTFVFFVVNVFGISVSDKIIYRARKNDIIGDIVFKQKERI